MLTRFRAATVVFATTLAGVSTTHAATTLANFESGSFAGWTLTGNAWSVGGALNTNPPVGTIEGNFFARSGSPNVFSGANSEPNVGSATSPAFQVSYDMLSWNSIGHSAPVYDGLSKFELLDVDLNVVATTATAQSDSWQTVSVNLLSLGFSAGDTFYFRATDAKTTNGYAWMGFDNLQLTGNAVAAVPEPEHYALLLAGLGLVGVAARGSKKYIR